MAAINRYGKFHILSGINSPSLAVFLSGALTGGGLLEGELIPSPPNCWVGVPVPAGTRGLVPAGGVWGLPCPGALGGP